MDAPTPAPLAPLPPADAPPAPPADVAPLTPAEIVAFRALLTELAPIAPYLPVLAAVLPQLTAFDPSTLPAPMRMMMRSLGVQL